jgi:hypothetical protein
MRNSGAGWALIDDAQAPAGHVPINIDSITTTSTDIAVNYTSLGGYQVGTFIATPDETLAQAGFFCGASVSPTTATIKLGQAGVAYADYVSYNGSAWVSANGVFTGIDYTAGVLTLNHPQFFGNGAFEVVVSGRGGTYVPVISNASPAVNSGYVKIEFRDWAGALVTTPDVNMKVYVSHGGGTRAVDPTTVTTSLYPNSNIWLLGMMELA